MVVFFIFLLSNMIQWSWRKICIVCSACMLFVSSYYSVTAVQSVLHDREYVHAVQRMHQYDMTVYNDPQLFRPLDHVTRQEAAKFFAVYADQFAQASDDRDTSVHCLFDDLGDADSTLVSYIHLACAQ